MSCLIWQGKLSNQDKTEQDGVLELSLEGSCSMCSVQEYIPSKSVAGKCVLALKFASVPINLVN